MGAKFVLALLSEGEFFPKLGAVTSSEVRKASAKGMLGPLLKRSELSNPLGDVCRCIDGVNGFCGGAVHAGSSAMCSMGIDDKYCPAKSRFSELHDLCSSA